MTSGSEPVRQNNQTPDTSNKTDTETDERKPDMPITLDVPATPPAKTHCEVTCKKEKGFWDHVKTGAEILGIVLLGIYTAYTIKMYCANRDAADAATRAAKAAEDGLKQTTSNAHLDQRAWVTVTSINLNAPAEGQPILIKLGVANTGKTPAFITTARYTIHINATINFPNVSYETIPLGAMVTPGIPIESDCTGHKLSQPEVNAIKAGGAFLYIDGYFNYRDVFNVEHRTGYCGLYNPKSDTFFQPPECNQRNYAD